MSPTRPAAAPPIRRVAPWAAVAVALAGCAAPGAVPETGGAPWELPCVGEAGCAARATLSGGAKHEPWLAASPASPGVAVVAFTDLDPAKSDGCRWIGLSATGDGGATWRESVPGGTFAQQAPGEPAWGFGCARDAAVAFAPSGALHLAYQVDGPGLLGRAGFPLGEGVPALAGSRFLLLTSADAGATWSGPVVLLDATPGAYANDLVVEPSTGAVLVPVYAPPMCVVLASRDGGRSVEPPVVVPPPADGAPLHACLSMAARGAGEVTLAFTVGGARSDGAPGAGNVPEFRFARSGDAGVSFEETGAFPYSPPEFVPALVELAYDASAGDRAGALYAAYADASSGELDVLVRSSPDGGSTWGEAVPVTDGADGDQWLPNVAVTPDGVVHVVFLDAARSTDATSADAGYATSADGGRTWRVARVTATPVDLAAGPGDAEARAVGDNLGISVGAAGLWLAFPDGPAGAGATWISVARAEPSTG